MNMECGLHADETPRMREQALALSPLPLLFAHEQPVLVRACDYRLARQANSAASSQSNLSEPRGTVCRRDMRLSLIATAPPPVSSGEVQVVVHLDDLSDLILHVEQVRHHCLPKQ